MAAIVWAPYERRTEQYAQKLGASLHKIHYLRYKRPLLAPLKYVPQCLKTWAVLRRQRPSLVYVTNPPVFAALSVYVYCRWSGASYVMDTHSPALYQWKWAWSVPLQRALAGPALVNVVDQDRYRQLFESWGARALTLRDPPLSISPDSLVDLPEPKRFNITVINTFASDEPLEPVLEAAERFKDVEFFILGDTSLARKSPLKAAPDNVAFTGYLLGDTYWSRLRSSRGIIALTRFRHSLLAGAQEAMFMGKPLIVSKQPALTDYFTKGAIFVDNSPQSLVDGVRRLRAQEERLTEEIVELAGEKRKQWESKFQELLSLIGGGQC